MKKIELIFLLLLLDSAETLNNNAAQAEEVPPDENYIIPATSAQATSPYYMPQPRYYTPPVPQQYIIYVPVQTAPVPANQNAAAQPTAYKPAKDTEDPLVWYAY
jgi:hypothetical protein